MKIIADAGQAKLEEVISNFLNEYFWFSKRISNMDNEHRDAVGILLETHPEIMLHLKKIFDRNLDEDSVEMKEKGVWKVTHEEYILLGLLGVPEDDDDIIIYNYKKGSGILDASGVEYDSTISNQNKAQ